MKGGGGVAGKISTAKIKKALIERIKARGDGTPYYLDLVDTYIALLETKIKLVDDISERGVMIPYNNGGGQKGVRDNPCIGQLVKVTQQLIKTLEALGIKPSCDEYGTEEL